MPLELLMPPLVMGLLGAGHCIGMCGGITAALAFATPKANPIRRFVFLLAYNMGRIFSYSAIGLLAGLFGKYVNPALESSMSLPILRIVAAVLIMSMGVYLWGLPSILRPIERIGQYAWRLIQPFGQRLVQVKSNLQAFMLGMVWGWLPCGLVYTALAYALTQDSPITGAMAMAAFGLGTLPSLLLGGLAGSQVKQWLQQRNLRIFMGTMLILFGLWTLLQALAHSGHIDLHFMHSIHVH